MKSTLKILVPVVLLLGGIFVITQFSIYTPREETEDKGPDVVKAQKPLQFFTSRRIWMPRKVYDKFGGSLQDVSFPGYFEADETQNPASFWFANRSPSPVRMQLRYVSCTSCSGGKMAPIPPEVSKQLLQMTAISTLPQGFASGMPLLMAVPAAQMDEKRDILKWQVHQFSKTPADIVFEVPGAPSGDKWVEPWAIMTLLFKAKPNNEMNTLTTVFGTSAQGEEMQFDEKLEIGYISSPPFEMDKSSIDIGELTDGSASQTHEVLIYSATRKPSQLPKLNVTVTMVPGASGEPGAFVTAGEPIPVHEDDFFDLMEKATQSKNKPVRMQTAYRLSIAISPKVGAAKLDIGRVERMVNVSFGDNSIPVRVVGTMRGPIYLNGAKEISFGFFTYGKEQTLSVTVETDRSGVDLRIVDELTQPKFLKLELQKQADVGERGNYKLKATLPANEQLGEIKDGVVVLEAKGPNPLRLRIPVTGRGR